MAFQHLSNFRDFGGYATVDGRTVKKGTLFRSDDLSQLDESETDRMANEYKIKTIIDTELNWRETLILISR